VDYQEWEKSVPADITGDVLWKLRAYRLALFVGDLAWSDVTKLLLTYIPDQRQVSLKEEPATYDALSPDLLTDVPL
jgi:hypothetical protein